MVRRSGARSPPIRAASCRSVGAVHHLRVLHPTDGIRAFYDGRIDGYRFADGANWVDDGALSLGIASYAIVDGSQALIYDTHVSAEHARFIRASLEAEGVRRFVVLLSHCHLDHIAGTAAFADCEVIATTRTAQRLRANRRAIEAGALEGPPGIDPLVLPTLTSTSACDSTSAASASSCSTSTSTVTTPPSCGWRNRECCSPATRWRTP